MLIVNEPLSEPNAESEYSFLVGEVSVGVTPEPVILLVMIPHSVKLH